MADHKEEEVIFDVESAYSKSESWVIENQNSLMIIFGVAVLMVVAFFGYKNFIQLPAEEEAKQEIWNAELAFQKDSLNLALNGSATFLGFLDIIDQYGSTTTGNLANYYAGVSYLRLGDYGSAINYLEAYDCNDIMVCAVALGATGDAYMELGQVDDAIRFYKSAANHSDNSLTTPLYLKKAGMAHEAAGDFADAAKLYTKIQKLYPQSNEGLGIDKYIARAEGLVKN